MKDDLEQLLRSLPSPAQDRQHLRRIAETFDDEVKRAEKADTSYQDFVARLMRAQWQANQEAQLKTQERARAQIRVAKHNEKPGLTLEGH